MRKKIRVVGMTCEHCVRAVQQELGSLEGVTGVDIDLGTGEVDVASDSPVEDSALAAAVARAGYEVRT